MNEKTVVPIPPDKQLAKRFRIIGVVILMLGLGSAILVYWRGTAPENTLTLATVMMGKKNAQASQLYFGKSEGLIEEWKTDLQQPGTQALIIVIVASLLAWGCFHLAKLSDDT